MPEPKIEPVHLAFERLIVAGLPGTPQLYRARCVAGWLVVCNIDGALVYVPDSLAEWSMVEPLTTYTAAGIEHRVYSPTAKEQ